MADIHPERKKDADTKTSQLATRVAEKADKLKYLIIALLVIVVAATAIFSYLRRQKSERDRAAENALFQAEVDLTGNPAQGEAFAALAKEYAGLAVGAKASIVTFAQNYNSREYVAAENAIRDFLEAYPQSLFVPRGKLALGQAMLMQGKTAEAVAQFREVAGSRDAGVYAEAKMALAQALERQAEEANGDPEEYKRRLELAAEEYADIVGQSQSLTQQMFWPQAVVLPADFSLVLLRDKLAGHTHGAPTGKVASAASAVPATIDLTQFPPPAADPVEAVRNEAEAAAVEAAMQGVAGAVEALQQVPPAQAEPDEAVEPADEAESAEPAQE